MNASFKKLSFFLALATFFVACFNSAPLQADPVSTDSSSSTITSASSSLFDSQSSETTEQEKKYTSYFSIVQDLLCYQEEVDLYHSKSPKEKKKLAEIAEFHRALEERGSQDQNGDALTNIEALLGVCNSSLVECIMDNNILDNLITLPSNKSLQDPVKLAQLAGNFISLKSKKESLDSHLFAYATAKKNLFTQAIAYDLAYQPRLSSPTDVTPPAQN